uniref:Putative secreted protein n=1 Tax=Anopheles darlingi TaxID=43151 RepID=A0A2M4D9J9_ANODA
MACLSWVFLFFLKITVIIAPATPMIAKAMATIMNVWSSDCGELSPAGSVGVSGVSGLTVGLGEWSVSMELGLVFSGGTGAIKDSQHI